MKGIIQNSRNWVDLDDSSTLNHDKFNKVKILLPQKNGDGKQVESVEMSVDDIIKQMGQNSDEYKYARTQIEADATALYSALNGEGRINKSIKEVVRNALNHDTFGTIFTPAIELFMADYITPRLVASNYLATTIPVGAGVNRSVIATIRAFGLIKVKEVARGGQLPIVTPNLDEYTEQIAWDIKRYGLKLEIDNDIQNSDEFGILGFLFTQVADAFRYRKEVEVMKIANSIAEVMYDNGTPASGTFKVGTSGRGIDGAHNGTVTLGDIIRILAYAMNRGINVATLVTHPYVLFNMYDDSELKNILGVSDIMGVAGTAGNALSPGWDHPFGDRGYVMRRVGADGVTNPGPIDLFGDTGMGPLGKLGVDPFSRKLATSNAYFTGRANIPGANLQVIALPQVPVKKATVLPVKSTGPVGASQERLVTNIYLIGDRKPTAILQGQAPTSFNWEDIEKEMSFAGFTEKYTVIPLWQGRGVYAIKNVVIDKNYTNFQAQYTVTPLGENTQTPIVQ